MTKEQVKYPYITWYDRQNNKRKFSTHVHMDIEMQSLIIFCIRSVVWSYSHFYRLNIHVLFHMRRFVDMRDIRIQVPLLHLLTMRLIR